MKFSYFSKLTSRQCRQLTVAELLDIMRSERIVATCKQILVCLLEGNEEEANRLKQTLPVVVLNRLYKEGTPRVKDGGEPTGVVMVDYDDLSPEDMERMARTLTDMCISQDFCKEHVLAAHWSARKHGIHVWLRWPEGCRSVAECQERFAQATGFDGYDRGCKDNSRCSFLVPLDYFFIQNFGAMERNEQYASIQMKNEAPQMACQQLAELDEVKNEAPAADLSSASPAAADLPQDYDGIRYEVLVEALVRACAPSGKLDAEGNVLKGARDNTAFRLCCLLRYCCDNRADWLYALMPAWARSLDNDQPGRLKQLCENACGRKMSFTLPKTLAEVIARLKAGAAAEQECADDQEAALEALDIEEQNLRSLTELPRQLPPIIHQCVYSLPVQWRPAAAVALLTMLGTIMSRIRGVYLDRRLHAPNVQVVIEAPFGSGKSNITDFAKLILTRITELDARGNIELNQYNELVEKANNSQTLPPRPDVLVRKITGDFTVAGFEQTLNTSKGLHIWCGTSEIDEVRKTWQAASYILRKGFDNDMYGRSLQSSKAFKGERPVFFNTLLCGTPKAVARCYFDPEDGLVSRTIFFKLFDVSEEMPVCTLTAAQRLTIEKRTRRLHDLYCCGDDCQPVAEVTFPMEQQNALLRRWLKEQYRRSVLQGNEAIDSFRRRDAVNGFRAALIAKAIYAGLGMKMTKENERVVNDYMLWVANYSLRMHLLKFGDQLNSKDDGKLDLARVSESNILDRLPESFTLAEAYRRLTGYKPSSVRGILTRLVKSGYLVQIERGSYEKK